MLRRLLVFALLLAAAPAAAQDWPTRPLRILVPFPAGGSADVQARVIAEELAKAVGQPVLVENKPGAGGNVAAAEAARAAPDGHTLFVATTGTHASNASLYAKLPYDPVKDFAPLTLVAVYPQVVVAGEWFAAGRSLDELVAALKREPGRMNYGSSGAGSPTHLAGELFKRETGADAVHVPYRGQAPALNDLVGGRLQISFPAVPDVLSFVQAGRLNAVAMMGETRSKALPDVPTTAELGQPRLLSSVWAGLVAPAGTPRPVLDRLARDLAGIVGSAAFRARFEPLGIEVRPSSPDEFARFMAAETARWGELIGALGIKAE